VLLYDVVGHDTVSLEDLCLFRVDAVLLGKQLLLFAAASSYKMSVTI
jgi:hypothetical protein